jgi:hypothetical protein
MAETITNGVGIVTFYGTNTFLTLHNNNGVRESVYAGHGGSKLSFDVEIAKLNEGIETGEELEAVGGWTSTTTNFRPTYEIETRPFLFSGTTYDGFTTFRSNLKSLMGYKYKYMLVSSYLYTVNEQVTSPSESLIIPITITGVEFSEIGNGKQFIISVQNSLLS